jgi:hypothetical protein
MMLHARVVLLAAFGVIPAAWNSALAQSVVSTHSGTVYFFEGSVYIGDQQLVQKFGRFPDIGEGNELRTDRGRAEVLLTPGAFLRIGENSAIRMVSTQFSDTCIELLAGSAILEANKPEPKTDIRLMYRNWQVRLAHDGVYRIDSEPAQVSVYRGQANVSVKADGPVKEEGAKAIAVRSSEVLPLAAVLVPAPMPVVAGDPFKNWAMSRSQAIASDNATSAGIMDDPGAIQDSTGSLGALSYFPLTGIPGLDLTSPYGLSFWSPFQSTLSSIYLTPYSLGLMYPTGWPPMRSAWPTVLRSPVWRLPGTLPPSPLPSGLHPVGGAPGTSTYSAPRMPYPVAPHPVAPHPVAPHPVAPHSVAPHSVAPHAGAHVGRR